MSKGRRWSRRKLGVLVLAVGIATVWATCGVRKAPRGTVVAVPGTGRSCPI